MHGSILRRGLTALCVLAALWAIVVWVTAGGEVQLGPFRLSSHSPRNPLLLSLVSGLAAWATSMLDESAGGAARRGRGAGFVVLIGLMALGLNVLMLAQPAMPTDKDYCMTDNPIGRGFRLLFTCDSYEFLVLAKEPARVVTTSGVRQSRPLSFGLAYLIAQPIHFLPRITRTGPYRLLRPEYISYLIINFALIVVAMVWFTSLLQADVNAPAGPELLFSLVVLSVNDITKVFFWSPHTQVYNLFIPCLTMYVTFRLIRRGEPLRTAQAALLGLAFGAGILIYGAFLIPVLSAVAIQLFLYRRLVPAVLVGAVTFVPYAAWVMFVRALTGSFYAHEVAKYRQYVWIADCAADGIAACGPVVTKNFWTFFTMAAPVILVPLVLVFCSRVARYVRPGPEPVPQSTLHALGLAIAMTFGITLVFLAMMGFYVQRLNWLLLPPILLALAVELRALRLSVPRRATWRFDASVVAVAVAYIVVLLERQGPYN